MEHAGRVDTFSSICSTPNQALVKESGVKERKNKGSIKLCERVIEIKLQQTI